MFIFASIVKTQWQDRIQFHYGDGKQELEDENGELIGPFDAIHVGASAKSGVPPALISQLKPGGRMIIPVNASYLQIDKSQDGFVSEKVIAAVSFVRLVWCHGNDTASL